MFDPTDQSQVEGLRDLPRKVLEAELCSTAAHIAAATCRFLLLLAEFDRRGAYAHWECVSAAHWLNWKCGLGLHAAREQVRVARRLIELPRVRAAFGEGRISYSKVRAITRVAHPAIEDGLVSMAEHATAQQMEVACSALRRCSDLGQAEAELEEQEQLQRDRAHLSLHSSASTGEMTGRLRLGAEAADIVQRALTTAMADIRAGSPQDEAPVGACQLKAAALVELARSYLANPATGPGPQPEIIVHVTPGALASPPTEPGPEAASGSDGQPGDHRTDAPSAGSGDHADPDRLDEAWQWPVVTSSGRQLSIAALHRLASDAGLRFVADLPDGTQLNLGRHQRHPGPALIGALRVSAGCDRGE